MAPNYSSEGGYAPLGLPRQRSEQLARDEQRSRGTFKATACIAQDAFRFERKASRFARRLARALGADL